MAKCTFDIRCTVFIYHYQQKNLILSFSLRSPRSKSPIYSKFVKLQTCHTKLDKIALSNLRHRVPTKIVICAILFDILTVDHFY